MAESFHDLLDRTDDVIEYYRANGAAYTGRFPVVPNEETNWLDEQRAAMRRVVLGDLSHHMTTIEAEGPDVVDLFADLCVNGFDDFPVGKAKQIVLATPDGEFMGDGPLLRLEEDAFWGVPTCADWIEYHVETGGYDVDLDVDPYSALRDGDPREYILQVQGPRAMELLGELTDDDLGAIGFYEFDTVELAGHEVRAFGHGMNTERGFEFHGPYADAASLRSAILEAGERYGIEALGSKSYLTQSVRLGWVPMPMPPVFGESMRAYREWLPADSVAGTYSLEGSFEAADPADYTVSPIELGYGRLIDFDGDFVGKEALAAEADEPERTLVSLVWDVEDTVSVVASIFREGVMDGENARPMALPRVQSALAAYDEVRSGGEPVGLSTSRAYQPDVAAMVSLAIVDVDHAEPGTEVAVVWGEPDGSPNRSIAAHEPTTIAATVEPVPYTEDRRKAGTAD